MNPPRASVQRSSIDALLRTIGRALCILGLAWSAIDADAHPEGPGGVHLLEWNNEYIGRVFAIGWPGKVVQIDGHPCLSGRALLMDVRDDFGRDIDEDVNVDLELLHAQDAGGELVVVYDKADEGPTAIRAAVPSTDNAEGSCRLTLTLARARLATEGEHGGDITLIAFGGTALTVRDVSLQRSHTTDAPTRFGTLQLEVRDERGTATPALVGLYDERKRLPKPGPAAVTFRPMLDPTRTITRNPLRGNVAYGASLTWPATNHSAFYVDGRYEAKVPAGKYDVVICKGPEYRFWRGTVEVRPNANATLVAQMERWDDLSANGWFSGDGHVHYAREIPEDDHSLLLLAQAEDLHVVNVLQMGNVANTHFRQRDWRIVASERDSTFILAPGQEDPRTNFRGHTIQLHLSEPVRESDRYFLYDRVFEQVRQQGGLTGYAHVGMECAPSLPARRGLALDVPAGLVDFVEILQAGSANLETWFAFLNLGYKLVPVAGTDFPYLDLRIGAVRNYVKVAAPFTPERWFAGLKAGETFVSCGPVIEFAINGADMGSELSPAPGDELKIEARARINPDIDQLESIELIEQGQVIHTVSAAAGATDLRLECRLPASRGTWFVIRAKGKRHTIDAQTLAVTSPIYVRVAGQDTWKPAEVPAIVQRLKIELAQLANHPPPDGEPEAFETHDAHEMAWATTQQALQERVDRAIIAYDDLVARATGKNSLHRPSVVAQ